MIVVGCKVRNKGQIRGHPFLRMFFSKQTTSVCRWWVGSDREKYIHPENPIFSVHGRLRGWVDGSASNQMLSVWKNTVHKNGWPLTDYTCIRHYHKEPTSLKMLYRPIGQNSENIRYYLSQKRDTWTGYIYLLGSIILSTYSITT